MSLCRVKEVVTSLVTMRDIQNKFVTINPKTNHTSTKITQKLVLKFPLILSHFYSYYKNRGTGLAHNKPELEYKRKPTINKLILSIV